jgi:hypothetical protein
MVTDHYVLAGVKRRYTLDRLNLTSPKPLTETNPNAEKME